MSNLLSGFFDNLGQGVTHPKGNLGDYSHASRLYIANGYAYTPKVKFLYHVVFNINPAVKILSLIPTREQDVALGMLVKDIELPKFKIAVDNPIQYNRKKQVQTKIEYDPITVTLHDDNSGLTTSLWTSYYAYYCADSKLNPTEFRKPLTGVSPETFKRQTYGLDNDFKLGPFFNSIDVYQMSRGYFQSMSLLNPLITSWQHDSMNNEEGGGVVKNAMSIAYEAVLYNTGKIVPDNPPGFATIYYDKVPSPLSVSGGGTTSIFGQGGVLTGISNVFGAVASGEIFSSPGALFSTVIQGINTANNIQKLTKEGIQQEAVNIIQGSSRSTTLNGLPNIMITNLSQKTAANIATPRGR